MTETVVGLGFRRTRPEEKSELPVRLWSGAVQNQIGEARLEARRTQRRYRRASADDLQSTHQTYPQIRHGYTPPHDRV